MALKDRIARDNHRVFMNEDHFARQHSWNGQPFVLVEDDTQAARGSQSWQENSVELTLFVPEDSLPARAQIGEFVLYDDRQMTVTDIIDALGMKEIHLSIGWSKGI